MRVITPAPARVRPFDSLRLAQGRPFRSPGLAQGRRARGVTLELLGLIAASMIVTFGIALAFAGKAGRAGEDAPSGGPVNLHALRSPVDLEPVLTTFTSAHERQVVAQASYRRATAVEPRLEHVGGLMDVTVPASEIRADRRLVQLNERLARRPDATEVAVLTATDLAALKPLLAVRTMKAFTGRSARSLVLLLA